MIDFLGYLSRWIVRPFSTSYELINEDEENTKYPLAFLGFLVGILSLFVYVIINLLINGMWINIIHVLQVLIFIFSIFLLDVMFGYLFNLVSGGHLYFREVACLSSIAMVLFAAFILFVPLDLIGVDQSIKATITLIFIGVHWLYVLVSVSGGNETNSIIRNMLGFVGSTIIVFVALVMSVIIYTSMGY